MTVTIADIEAAARAIEGLAVATPLVESPALNEALGGRVLLKPETLQRGGAFKFRGAMNKISKLSDEQRARGVVACSSGNHAQGVALAARMVGAPAVIVMPKDAPAKKIANTRGYGAEVILYDRYTENREAITEGVAADRGMSLVWPYDDLDIIAGQGTVGLELEAQARGVGARLDLAFTPIGGGGLAAGVSTAIKHLSPATEVYGVEPAAFDDTARSFATGERQTVPPDARSICDSLLTPGPGRLTLPLNMANLSGVLTVTDAEVAEAMRFAFTWLKLVVEPGGCVALAALLAGKVKLEGRTAGVVLSGGNVDPELFGKILAAEI
ncbi:MAG: pyridoxal-5-phosphate-dependent protein [Caulobacter sp.]|nr:pyridoxal-5-phosphate-dependent protein [Caulobacter sp.]